MRARWQSATISRSEARQVNAVIVAVPPAQMFTTIMSYSETVAALVRRVNQGLLGVTAFTAAQVALRNEVIDSPDFLVLGLEFDDILDGNELVRRHNRNSTDGAMLQAFLRHAVTLRPTEVSVLAASDQRLLRAAKAEGLEVLNPESVDVANVPAFLAAL